MIDELLVKTWVLVGYEAFDLLWFRRQPDQIKVEPANQRAPVRFKRWAKALLFELGQNEQVNRITDPGTSIPYRRERGPLERFERPPISSVRLLRVGAF